MGYTLELQDPAEVGPLGQELNGAPVVELEELSQDEDGEELMLGEVLAGTDGGVFGQRLPGGCQCLPHQGEGRSGHRKGHGRSPSDRIHSL